MQHRYAVSIIVLSAASQDGSFFPFIFMHSSTRTCSPWCCSNATLLFSGRAALTPLMLTSAVALAEMFGDEDESGLLRRTWRFLHDQGYINTGVLHGDPSQHARENAVLSLRTWHLRLQL